MADPAPGAPTKEALPKEGSSPVARVLAWLRGEYPQDRFDGFVELGQADVPPEVVPAGQGDALHELFPPADHRKNPLQIRIDPRFADDRLQGYRLCASGRVGVAAVGDPDTGLPIATVTVKPKVPGASLLTMLSYAFVPDLSPEQRAQIDVKDAPVVSLVILLYLYRLEQMVKEHGLQRAYTALEEDLRSTVRGRCMLGEYLGRRVPAGQAHVVPCRYWELRIDSEPNRALRWGVELCRIIADWLSPSGLGKHVEQAWNSLAPHFAGVPPVPCQASQVRRLPRSGRFSAYESTFELLELLLDNLSLDLTRGQVRVRGFAVEMWQVFEQFVVNGLVLRLHRRVRGPQMEYTYTVHRQQVPPHTQTIRLDAVIEGPRRLVVDTKWKEAIMSGAAPVDHDPDALHIEELHIRNADLFQVVAYGKHREVQAQASVLVYPVLEPILVCKERCIADFAGAGGDRRPYPIFLIGVPVGKTLDESLDHFVSVVQRISEGPTELENAAALKTIRAAVA